MGVLQIRIFGRFRVVYDDGAEAKLTPTAQTLLAYLLVQRAYCTRDVLATLCWGDQPDEQARSCLSTALWRLRRSLETAEVPHGAYLLTTTTGEVSFNWESQHWLDLATFEHEVKRVLALPPEALDPSHASALQNALGLCTGDLLEGFYDDWALRQRERVRTMYLDSLSRLMRYHHSRGAYEESVAAAQKILACDPLREEIHREVMRLHLKTGQRALAVRQFRICREVLADELGIPPMAETQALYHQIMQDADEPHGGLDGAPVSAHLPQALTTLRQAMQEFDLARSQLQRAIHLVERLTESSPAGPKVRPR
jgi:DNA-binding SARP family transcriptional activator